MASSRWSYGPGGRVSTTARPSSGSAAGTGSSRTATCATGGNGRWRCGRCVGEDVTRRHRKIEQTLVDLAGGACAVCGYDRTLVDLHFHHVDPSTKSFGVSIAGGNSLAAYAAEARKCVLVCANCHGEIEAGLVPCPPLAACWADAS